MKKFILLIFLFSNILASGLPSGYYEIKNTKQMKEYFFNFFDKLATKQNNLILEDRKFVKSFYIQKDAESKDSIEYKRFKTIQKRYKLKDSDSLAIYLKHIDILPNSLVLVQAAVESGWGKSRFVKEANNIFGQWTWSGKGLIPKSRDTGKTHKIKIFNSLESAVRGYMINLNKGWGYKALRDIRENMRNNNQSISSIPLANSLINYSQKKEVYTKLLVKMILQNKLQRFDK